MKLVKAVEVPQGRHDAIECEVNGYNSRTRESGTFMTAEQHGCRPISCTQHWKHVPLPAKFVHVEVTFDEHKVAEALAYIAARNTSGKAVEFSGLLRAKVMRSEVQK